MLDVHLSATCSRNRFTADPGPVIDQLRQIAGDRLDILAMVAGTWAGYYRDTYSAVLCDALLEIPGARKWEASGRAQRGKKVHGTQT